MTTSSVQIWQQMQIAIPIPSGVLPAVPFTSATTAPVARCSTETSPNWDGTPAHSSGDRGRPSASRKFQGGVP